MTDALLGPGACGPTASPVTGLSHLQLNVSDVDASALWYTAVLGLEPFARDPALGYVALRHRGANMVIVLTPVSDPVADPRPAPGGNAGGPTVSGPGAVDHVAFAVPDGEALLAWAEHLTAIGVEHPGVVLEGGNPSLQLRDPDGTALELVAPGVRPEHRSDRLSSPGGDRRP